MIFGLLLNFKPFICHGCDESSGEIICRICLGSMKKNNHLIHPQNSGIKGIFPIFISFPTTHKILVYWKNHSGEELKKTLFAPSPELKTELKKMNFELVIPIPQHVDRSLKRGHASAFEVAKFFSQSLNIPLNQNLKLNNIEISKQANLDEWERKYSENPFHFEPIQIKIKNILIVDDLITTGSTLDKAANAILAIHPKANIYAASLGWKPKKMN